MLNRRLPFQRGVSLVELMIGITVGLVILGGVLTLYVDFINSNRTMLLSTRLTQEMRSAADMVARDLRRAGYWGNATLGIAANDLAGADNGYATVSLSGSANQNVIAYQYAADTDDVASNTEKFAYRLENGALQMSKDNGITWDDLTDSSATTITKFSVSPVTPARTVSMQEYCLKTGAAYPVLTIREYDILISGVSKSDATIKREIRLATRIRADEVAGACPV